MINSFKKREEAVANNRYEEEFIKNLREIGYQFVYRCSTCKLIYGSDFSLDNKICHICGLKILDENKKKKNGKKKKK